MGCLVSRFVTLLGTVALIAAAALPAGCSNDGAPILSTTSNAPRVEVFIPEIKGRPAEVAFISACAQAYGYAHDPVKLKAAYLGYEAKRGANPAQRAEIERGYEATYQAIEALAHRKASFCSTKDGEEVKAELRRYTSGFFEARSPSPAAASADWKKGRSDPDCGARC